VEHKIDDGGPAFPQNDAGVNRINNQDGMSLRDWFAGMALQGIIASGCTDESGTIVAAAYIYADIMLAERVKKRGA
jgi:hypothetical protein